MSVSEQHIASKLERNVLSAQVTQDGGNKLPAKIFDFNFLLFVSGLGEYAGKYGWPQPGEDSVRAFEP
jgi:hypothetical protein